eukprot:760786-Hanusia_phi.AAC.5
MVKFNLKLDDELSCLPLFSDLSMHAGIWEGEEGGRGGRERREGEEGGRFEVKARRDVNDKREKRL